MSALDGKGTKFPNGINVDVGELFIADVAMTKTAAQLNDVATLTGTETLTNKTLTAPKIADGGFIADANGNEVVKCTTTASAVNEITVANAATNNPPSIASTGGDTNIGITLKGKGTGAVTLGQATSVGIDLAADQPLRDSSSNELIKFTKTATAVNEITVANAATGGAPTITATGGDTNIGLTLSAKGTGVVTINDADVLKEGTVSSHDYAAGTTAWTLSATEKLSTQLICTNAGGAVDLIAPSENRIYWIYNNSGQNVTIKKTAGTGFAVATGKYAGAYYNGSDYARLTPDL